MKKIKNVAILALLIGVLFASNVFMFNLMAGGTRVGYCADDLIMQLAGNETINFTDREEEYIETVNGVPTYSTTSELSNACGAVAGAIIVGFYDKYYTDLIDGYASSFASSGKYKSADKTYIPALISKLYTLMRTNVDDVGVSESDCLSGLKSYVESTGHAIDYSSVKTASKLNENNYKNAIEANKPVLIFSKQTEVYNFIMSDTYAEFSSTTVNGNHIFVGYGYYQIKYYNGSTNFRTDTYIKVASGLAQQSTGYLKVSSTVDSNAGKWFDNGYVVSVS